MIRRRSIPFRVYIVILIPVLILSFYASAAFLYEDLSIGNFLDYIVRGCLENHFLPWRIINEKTGACLAIGVIGWVFLVSYMMYHYRNWQHGKEHGTADWSDPFEMTKRRGNVDTTKNRWLSKNLSIDTQGKGKLSNNNMLVVGTAGTYKTTSIVLTNVLHAVSNMIVLDVKGEISYKCALYLQKQGYTVRCLNLKNQEQSDRYNPFDYIENEEDVITLISIIADACTPPDAMQTDPFWPEGRDLYLQAVFYYEWYRANVQYPREHDGMKGLASFNNVLELLNDETRIDEKAKVPDGQKQPTILESKMRVLEKWVDSKEGPGEGMKNPAIRDYWKLKSGAAETVRSIIIIVNAMLKRCQTEGMHRIFEKDELHLRDFATGVGGTTDKPNLKGKIALFLIVDDEDDSFNFVCSMVYSQAIRTLSRMADNSFKWNNGALPIPLEFWMDEFYKGARPRDVQGVMGVVRSRNISLIPILQSKAQLVDLLKTEKFEIVMDNCPMFVFLGCGIAALETKKWISELLGNMTIDTAGDTKNGMNVSGNYSQAGATLMDPVAVGKMPLTDCIVFLQSEYPIYDEKRLPWENRSYSFKQIEKMRKRAAKKGIPFDNPNYWHDAMELNKRSKNGGYVHDSGAYRDPMGRLHTCSERSGKNDRGKYKSMSDFLSNVSDDMLAAVNLPTLEDKNRVSLAEFARYRADMEREEGVHEVIQPQDRDISGTVADVLNRYPDIVEEKTALDLIFQLLQHNIPESLILPLFREPMDEFYVKAYSLYRKGVGNE